MSVPTASCSRRRRTVSALSLIHIERAVEQFEQDEESQYEQERGEACRGNHHLAFARFRLQGKHRSVEQLKAGRPVQLAFSIASIFIEEGEFMSKTEAAKKLFEECKDMDIDETMDLVLNAETEEEQDFFSMLSDFILQRKQKKVIAQKRF